jgi:hypothetical protein
MQFHSNQPPPPRYFQEGGDQIKRQQEIYQILIFKVKNYFKKVSPYPE